MGEEADLVADADIPKHHTLSDGDILDALDEHGLFLCSWQPSGKGGGYGGGGVRRWLRSVDEPNSGREKTWTAWSILFLPFVLICVVEDNARELTMALEVHLSTMCGKWVLSASFCSL